MSDETRAAYAEAQAISCAGGDPTEALCRTVATDPTHLSAAVDLSTWRGEPVGEIAVGRTPWERRHLEIVGTAQRDPTRAEALLREHCAAAGCDPIARRIVERHLGDDARERLADLAGRGCSCGG